MAKIRKIYDQTIKPDGTKTTIYPITSTRAVYTPEGETLDSLIKSGDILKNTALEGYKACDSIEDLPGEETKYGYLIGENLYVWVGEGGDTLLGAYQNCGPFKGPKGDPGDPAGNLQINEEDLAFTEEKLEFANRDSSDGLAYKILRQDKSFAEQVTDENTIYEIRYNFTLNDTHTLDVNEECSIGGVIYYHNSEPFTISAEQTIALPIGTYLLNSTVDTVLSSTTYTPSSDTSVFIAKRAEGQASYYTPETITIPAGCILRFCGGKLSNGALQGTSTILDASPVQIFDNVVVQGFNFDKIDIRWFGAKEGEDIADVMDVVMKTYNQNIGVPIKMIGSYTLSRTVICNSGIVIWNDYMVPDLFENKIYAGHAIKPLGRLDVAAGIIAFDCRWTGTLETSYAPRGTFAFRGIRFVAEAQKDGSDNPTILVRHRISEQPPRGFKVEDCQFENFDKVILCDKTNSTYGSVISNFLIDNCTFISDNGYALWVKNINGPNNSGDLMINGLEMVRCTLYKTKLYLVGLYGVNKISEIVINGTQNTPLADPVYIRMKYGTLELDQWYEEWLSGDFTIIGESGFNKNEYDLQTVVKVSNWYTIHHSYKIDTDTHSRLIFENVSVQEIPDLFPKQNIIFNNAAVDADVMEGRNYGAIDIKSLLPESGANYSESAGIYYGSMLVKTDHFKTAPNSAGTSYFNGSGIYRREPIFRGFFNDTGGTTISYKKLDNFYARNHFATSVNYTLTNLTSDESPFDDTNTFLLTFYKDINSLWLDFKDANENVILSVRTPIAPGVALVMLKGNLTQIKSLTIRRSVSVTESITTSYIGIQRLIESPNGVSKYQALSQFIVLLNNNPRKTGTTAQRPAGAFIDIGYEYFDTTLGKPIYASALTDASSEVSVTWVDATGATV